MTCNSELSGARLIKIEYGTVADFTETNLSFNCLLYVSFIFKKGNKTMRHICRLLNDPPLGLTTYLNKIVDRKEEDGDGAVTFFFIDGYYINLF